MGNKIERESSKPCRIGGILLKVNAESNSGISVLYAGAEIWVSYHDLMHRLAASHWLPGDSD